MATRELTLAKLRYKIEEWLATIEDSRLASRIRKNYILAGGAIVSTILDQEVNDYDVWITDPVAMKDILNYYFDRDKVGVTAVFGAITNKNSYGIKISHPLTINDVVTCRDGYWIEKIGTDNIASYSHFSMTLQNKVQLIYGRNAGACESLVSSFDFAHNKVYITNNKDNITPQAIETIQDKHLFYNTGSAYPMSSLLRIPKFIAKGMTIHAVEMKRILNDILAMSKHEQEDQMKFVIVSSDGEIIT